MLRHSGTLTHGSNRSGLQVVYLALCLFSQKHPNASFPFVQISYLHDVMNATYVCALSTAGVLCKTGLNGNTSLVLPEGDCTVQHIQLCYLR